LEDGSICQIVTRVVQTPFFLASSLVCPCFASSTHCESLIVIVSKSDVVK
jgi:hypothetical protein